MGERKGNPQIEDGYTKIANELFEAIYGARFTITQLQIVLCIVRYTYGFNRKTWKLSSGFIATAIGRKPRNVQKDKNSLIEANILIYEKSSSTSCRKLGINKKYNTWKIETYGRTAVSNDDSKAVSAYGRTAVNTYGATAVSLTVVEPYKKEKFKDNKEKEKKEESSTPIKTLEQIKAEDTEGMSVDELLKSLEGKADA